MHTLSDWHFMYTHIQHTRANTCTHTHQLLVRNYSRPALNKKCTNSKHVFHLGKGLALLLLPAFFVSGLAQKATSIPFSLPVKLKWKENLRSKN